MGGYWVQPETTASAALARTSSGPGSSGKPWPRLAGLGSRARRDITSKTVTGRSAKIGFMGGPAHYHIRRGAEGEGSGQAAVLVSEGCVTSLGGDSMTSVWRR